MTVRVIGPREPKDEGAINTTSRSGTWSRGLSPFFLGPVPLYGGREAANVENAWQFSKVYPVHVDRDDKLISDLYFDWAEKGWADKRAHRYPMGKGAKPLFSLWDGERLTYVQARKKVYVPLYAEAVQRSAAFRQLRDYYEATGEVTLWDFDGYDHRARNMSYRQVVNDQNLKMGHAFVIAMLLEGKLEEATT